VASSKGEMLMGELGVVWAPGKCGPKDRETPRSRVVGVAGQEPQARSIRTSAL
jgi:hypothetical protein